MVNTFSDFISNNIDNFRDLLPNGTIHFFRVHIKQYIFRELLPNKNKHFSEFISDITDIFRKLLPNNTTRFSRHQAILTF